MLFKSIEDITAKYIVQEMSGGISVSPWHQAFGHEIRTQ